MWCQGEEPIDNSTPAAPPRPVQGVVRVLPHRQNGLEILLECEEINAKVVWHRVLDGNVPLSREKRAHLLHKVLELAGLMEIHLGMKGVSSVL